MGADMTIAGMVAPHRPDAASIWDFDLDLARRVGHDRIDAYDLVAIGDHDLDWLAEMLGIKDWIDLDDDAAPARTDLVCDVRTTLHVVLELLFANRRDVTSAQFGGRLYWVSGGLSWGDSPTDAYDWLRALDLIGLYEEALPDAR